MSHRAKHKASGEPTSRWCNSSNTFLGLTRVSRDNNILSKLHQLSYKSLLAYAHKCFLAHDYALAEDALLKAFDHAKQHGLNSSAVAEVFLHLAQVLIKTGRVQEAESHFLSALEIRKSVFGPSHIQTAACLDALADFYYDQSRYSAAQIALVQSLAISQHYYGPNNLETARILGKLAAVYHAQEKYEQAEFEYKAALAIQTPLLGFGDPSVVRLTECYVTLLQMLGRFQEADELLASCQGFLSGRWKVATAFKKLDD